MDEREFIKRAGAIEVLCELVDNEKTFGELKELGISSGTLSKRPKEAIELRLIRQEIRREKDSLKPKVVYQLTEDGKKLIESIKHVRNEYLRIKEEIERLKEEIKKKEENLKKLFERVG